MFELTHVDGEAEASIRGSVEVELLERPGHLSLADQQVVNLTSQWGLDVIDQQSLTRNNQFNYFFKGAGTHIYIVDTGIRCSHVEFPSSTCQGTGYSAVGGPPWVDAVGHGTSMASLAAGLTTGTARQATLHSVRVALTAGGNDEGDVIDGLHWVRDYATQPAVANVSLANTNGPLQGSFKTALNELAASGVMVMVGAGNGGLDGIGDNVCNLNYNQLLGEIIVISAVDVQGVRPGFANFGACLDIFAPGIALRRATAAADNSYDDLGGGTSSATAIVTGVVATIRQQRPTASGPAILAHLQYSGTSGLLSSLGSGSPNLLVNSLALHHLGLTGPASVLTVPNHQYQTWTVSSPWGGDGTYTYAWYASVNYAPYVLVGTSQSYTRFFPRFSEYTLILRAEVSSAGVTFTNVPELTIPVTCGGC